MNYKDVIRHDVDDEGRWKNVEIAAAAFPIELDCWVLPLGDEADHFACLSGDCPHETFDECCVSLMEDAPIQPGDQIRLVNKKRTSVRVLNAIYARPFNLQVDAGGLPDPGDRTGIVKLARSWAIFNWQPIYGQRAENMGALFVEFDEKRYRKNLMSSMGDISHIVNSHCQLLHFVASKLGPDDSIVTDWSLDLWAAARELDNIKLKATHNADGYGS